MKLRVTVSFPQYLVVSMTIGLLCSQPTCAAPRANDHLMDVSLDELLNTVVTSRKRDENIIDVPISVSNFTERMLRDYHVQSFADYASKTPNLSYAYGNAFTVGNPSTGWTNARSIAIRGVAGARATGLYIDDTPLPGAVDPRIIDMQSIEVLKGPQGTLYGEGSLGGNIRLISRKPSLSQSEFGYLVGTGQSHQGDGLNFSAEAVRNVVVDEGRSALRMSLALDDYAGYINRSYLSDIADTSSARRQGESQGGHGAIAASITGLLRATPDFDISPRFIYQSTRTDGFPASYAPLPAFSPPLQMDRRANIQSQARDTWALSSLLLTYRGSGWTLNSTTSAFDRRTRDREDATEGGLLQAPTLDVQPMPWESRYRSKQISHETRVAFDGTERLSGTAGVFYSRHQADYAIPPTMNRLGGVPEMQWDETESNTQTNWALFGELYYKLSERWTLTLGDRWYRLAQKDTHTVRSAHWGIDTTSVGETASAGHSPKLALSYKLPTGMVYGSATKGFRQGNTQLDAAAIGCNPGLTSPGTTAASLRDIKPDSVVSYELGGKFEVPKPGLIVTAALFHVDWSDPQQQLLLRDCGLFVQGNAGKVTIDGGEVEVSGNLSTSLKFRGGLGWENSRVTDGGNTGQAKGSRIYHVPKLTASLGLVHTSKLNDALTGQLLADLSYTSNSVSANTIPPGTGPHDLVRRGYTLLNLGGAVNWAKSELALRITNATNAKPNLGELTYIGYGLFTDTGKLTPIPQAATLRSRTVMLLYSERF